MKYFIAVVLLGILIPGYAVYAYNLKCPSAGQWRLRAQSYCGEEEKYTCLYNIDERKYTENCNGPRIESHGEKTEINNGNFNNVDCSEDRYLPLDILFSTREGSVCLYLKSNCNEEGQVVYSNGSTTEDRTCGCNYKQQYAFVTQNLTNSCYCIPSVEDCSCYKKRCSVGYILSQDYQCVPKNETGRKYSCNEILHIENTKEEVYNVIKKGLKMEKKKGRGFMLIYWKRIEIHDCYRLFTTKSKAEKVADGSRNNTLTCFECRMLTGTLTIHGDEKNIRTIKEKRLYIKVNIIGKHGVGKSSLLRRLLNEGIEDVESTDVIDIDVRRCKIRMSDGKWIFDQAQDPKKEYATRIKRALQTQNEEFTMEATQFLMDNVEHYEDENEVYVEIGFWDFAGEKENYGTHHTFLDSDALYLLVTDCSEDLRQMEPCVTFDSIGNYIDFWFDTIHNCRDAEGETTGTQLDPPVIVVCTGLDKLTGNVNEKKDTFRLNLKDAIRDGRKIDHIRKVCFVSNTRPSESDFDYLRNLIFEYGKQLQSFGEELPLKWIRLEQSLDVLRESGFNIISRDDVLDLARKCDIEETGEVDKFLLHQHKMGSIIYFEDIKDCVILNQQWLADAFKYVVSDKIDNDVTMTDDWELLLKTGILEISLLEQLFEKEPFYKYQDHILQVLIKFDIIGRNSQQGKDIYYMPYMIKPEFSPSLQDIVSHFGVDQGHCRKTPWLCYEFDFFPISFFMFVMLYFIRRYEICFDNKLNKRSIYHGVGVYFLDSTKDHKLIVVFCKNTIAFQIWHWGDFPKDKYQTILIEVKQVIDKLAMKYKAKNLRYYVKMKCPDGDVNSKTGRISYCDFLQKSTDRRYFCDEHNFKHDTSQLLDTWFYSYQNLPIKFHQRCTTCNSEPSEYWCFECKTSLCENCNGEHLKSVKHHVQQVQDKYALDYTFNVNVGYISDIKLVSDGLLCVADFDGRQLVTIDITSHKQQSIPLPGEPLCITVVDNSTVAVTLSLSIKVVIVDIRQSHIIKHIDVKERCRGIMYSNNQLFVCCIDKTIKVLSMSGNITNTIQLSFIPEYICGSDDISIYCTDNRKLYCIDTKGHVLFTFTHPDMNRPCSITTDDTGHVLVVSQSNNILSISPDGKQCQIIVKHIPEKIGFSYICYLPQSKSLVVGTGHTIDVYKLWNVD